MTHPDFDRCKHWIEAALNAQPVRTHTIEDVEKMIHDGHAILLSGRNCAMVLEPQTYPLLNALHIWLAGGDLAELHSFAPRVLEIKNLLGCKVITEAGRLGWLRELKKRGARLAYVVLIKD